RLRRRRRLNFGHGLLGAAGDEKHCRCERENKHKYWCARLHKLLLLDQTDPFGCFFGAEQLPQRTTIQRCWISSAGYNLNTASSVTPKWYFPASKSSKDPAGPRAAQRRETRFHQSMR